MVGKVLAASVVTQNKTTKQRSPTTCREENEEEKVSVVCVTEVYCLDIPKNLCRSSGKLRPSHAILSCLKDDLLKVMNEENKSSLSALTVYRAVK